METSSEQAGAAALLQAPSVIAAEAAAVALAEEEARLEEDADNLAPIEAAEAEDGDAEAAEAISGLDVAEDGDVEAISGLDVAEDGDVEDDAVRPAATEAVSPDGALAEGVEAGGAEAASLEEVSDKAAIIRGLGDAASAIATSNPEAAAGLAAAAAAVAALGGAEAQLDGDQPSAEVAAGAEDGSGPADDEAVEDRAEGLNLQAAPDEDDGTPKLDVTPEAWVANRRVAARILLRSILAKFAPLYSADVEEVDRAEEEDDRPKLPELPPMLSIVWLELKKGELCVNPDAVDVFTSHSGYCNPVMISGKLRTGKSYLMNALSQSTAFGVSAQARSFTMGVHICNRLVPCTQFGGPEGGPKLAFVDCEGQADKGKSYDIKLATPLLLVSKVIIMNEVCPTGPSKEDILRTIEIFMRAAEQVSERKKRKALFGNLHLIMRDCAQPEQECWDIIFEMEDPNESETDEQAKAIDERNKIREGIFVAFETVPKVWCTPKLRQSHAPANYRDCDPEYVRKIDQIRAHMADQLKDPKLLDEKPLTGTMIAALMPQLVEALKSDSPILNPPSMMQAVCDLEAERIAQTEGQEADRFFRVEMVRRLPLASPYYEGEMDCAKALIAQRLLDKLDHLPTDSREKVFPPFESRLLLMDERLAAMNREKLADRATQEALDRASHLEQQMEVERARADDARSEIDNLLQAREAERARAEMLMKQIEDSNAERQGERDRILELEELLNKEASEREADLQRQVADEQKKVEEAKAAMVNEQEVQKEAAEEQERLMEEQRVEMEKLQAQMEEERAARAEAEKELGLREEEIGKEDEAAEIAERAAEAKKEIPLIMAVKDKDLYAVRGLVRRHPDSLHMKDKNQRSALHFVEDVDVTTALLKAKGDPNANDMAFWTPLHNAASLGLAGVAQCLMKANGNVLLTTQGGNTALDLCYARPDMTVLLLSQLPELYNTLEDEHRALAEDKDGPDDEEAQDDEDETPLRKRMRALAEKQEADGEAQDDEDGLADIGEDGEDVPIADASSDKVPGADDVPASAEPGGSDQPVANKEGDDDDEDIELEDDDDDDEEEDESEPQTS